MGIVGDMCACAGTGERTGGYGGMARDGMGRADRTSCYLGSYAATELLWSNGARCQDAVARWCGAVVRLTEALCDYYGQSIILSINHDGQNRLCVRIVEIADWGWFCVGWCWRGGCDCVVRGWMVAVVMVEMWFCGGS